MTLRVEVSIPVFSGGEYMIGTLACTRMEPLRESDHPDAEVYRYSVDLIETSGAQSATTIDHRYGDGPWTLISNALAALGYPENEEMRP